MRLGVRQTASPLGARYFGPAYAAEPRGLFSRRAAYDPNRPPLASASVLRAWHDTHNAWPPFTSKRERPSSQQSVPTTTGLMWSACMSLPKATLPHATHW